jgi:hypothetical protein
MAATGAPFIAVVPAGGVPAVATAPHPPFGGDPGTITGWLLDAYSTATLSDISRGLAQGFDRLVDNISPIGDPGYNEVMRNMMAEVICSDTLVTYATNIGNDAVRITTDHSIHIYSAGVGDDSNVLHGKTLALLGEMMGTQLPMLVQFNSAPTENFEHAMHMEGVAVPSDAVVDAYFTLPTAEDLLPHPTPAQGGINMNLTNLCPIPLAWPPYFLDFKAPYTALVLGCELVATMTDAGNRTRVGPLLDWLWAACCVRLGPAGHDRVRSLVN